MEKRLSGVPTSMVLLVLLGLCQYTHADCSAYFGPSGSFDCISAIPGQYDKRQYATCLTKTYIEQKSKGRHSCADQTRTYCYYQCMLELHDLERATVTDDCTCDPGGVITTRRPEQTTLDPACLSPTGEDCSWYRNCLEKKFQCEGSSDDYAIGYAAKFCNNFIGRSYTLSPNGSEWMDAVRKCLQVSLVPVLRSFYTPTCAEIKQRAFDSHADCYLQPYTGAPSICDLPLSDFWSVFWTIKSAFRTDFSQSVYGLVQVMTACAGSKIKQLETKMRNLVINLRLPGSIGRQRRSADTSLHENPTAFLQEAASALARHRRRAREVSDTDVVTNQETELEMEDVKRVVRQAPTTWRGETDTALYYHKLANQASVDMARQLGWDAKGVTWFASGNYTGNNALDVHILLADSQAYGASTTGGSQPNMTAVVVIAAQMFEEGKVTVSLEGQRVQLKTLIACGDLSCQTEYLNATAPASAGMRHQQAMGVAGVATFVLLVGVAALFNGPF